MKNGKVIYSILISIVLAAYYLILGVYVHKNGYFNHEQLFDIEKGRIIFEGIGDRLKIIGLTSPLIPFYGMLPFIGFHGILLLAPTIASAMGTAVLFLIMSIGIGKRTDNQFLIIILLLVFLFHPGIIYMACSGKGIYAALIFFFLFFYNIFRFYISNTTFHISIASIFFVVLIFCDYRFIWLSLFFIPLVISIALQSLNLSEKQSIFRLSISFNNLSLRRKLINKTLAIYVIIFILPVICILCYKILNQTHANDFNYFNDNSYATWNVYVNYFEGNITPSLGNYSLKEISFLTSLRMVIYCPLILVGMFLFRRNSQYLLTVLMPFGFVEFLKIKYEDMFLTQEYHLIFVIMALLAITFNHEVINKSWLYKAIIILLVFAQIYTGYHYLNSSLIQSENDFVQVFVNKTSHVSTYDDYHDVADMINRLPEGATVLADDADAYGVVVFVHDMNKVVLPYQVEFLGAIENPKQYVDYVLIAGDSNPVAGFTQLNNKYKTFMQSHHNTYMDPVYISDNWTLYKIWK